MILSIYIRKEKDLLPEVSRNVPRLETSPEGREKLSKAKKKRKPRKDRQRMRKREERIDNGGGEWVKQEGRPKGSFLSQGGGRGSGRVAAKGGRENLAQRNANGRVGLDMQRKKYLRRARTVEYCVKAGAEPPRKRNRGNG